VKADRLQISRTLANENDISAAAERQPFWRSHDIVDELGTPLLRTLRRFSCRSFSFIKLVAKCTSVYRLSSPPPILCVNMRCPFFIYILHRLMITCMSKAKDISVCCKIL
jgi:hypothetical protein